MNFKHGDRVRIIRNRYDHSWPFHVGDDGTITEKDFYKTKYGYLIEVKFSEKVGWNFYDWEIKQIK